MHMRSLFCGKNLFFVNFKYHKKFFSEFERRLKPIDLVLLQKMESQAQFQKRYFAITDFLGQKQTCILGADTRADKVGHLLSPSLNFGVLVGCKMSGKKTLLKELKKHLKFEVISVANIVAKIKEKKEEDGLQEDAQETENFDLENNSQTLLEEEKEFLINQMRQNKLIQRKLAEFREAVSAIKEFMLLRPHSQFVIEMDPSDLPREYFDFLRQQLSTPRFVVFVDVSFDNYLARYKTQNSLDDIGEDEMAPLEEHFNKFVELKQFLIGECQKIDFLNLVDFNNNVPLEHARKNMVSIFQKDLLFVVDRVNGRDALRMSIDGNCDTRRQSLPNEHVRKLLKLNCIRNEIGWVDFNECREAQFRTQRDIHSILRRKLHQIRENSTVHFLYHRLAPDCSFSKFR